MATSLTIFKIKAGITDHDEIIVGRDRLRNFPVRLGRELLGILYIRRNPLKLPRWLGFFDGVVDFEGVELRTTAASAVLVIQRESSNVFALAFGYGRWMIRETAIESRFGLRVTLNAIDPSSIQSIDHKRLEAISRQTREQLSRASGLQYFGLDVERDLLRAVTGRPRDEQLASRLVGGDQLTVVADITIRGLGAALDRFASLSRGMGYRRDFGFVDYIAEVTDTALLARLDSVLVTKLQQRTPPTVWLAPPEILAWDEISGFRYRGAAAATIYDDLALANYLSEIGSRRQLTVDRLRNDRVRSVNAVDGSDRQQWSVYRCIVAEMTIRDRTYILNEGRWYLVDRDFLAEIDTAVAALPQTTAVLPPFRQRSEREYNHRAQQQSPRTGMSQAAQGCWDLSCIGSVRSHCLTQG